MIFFQHKVLHLLSHLSLFNKKEPTLFAFIEPTLFSLLYFIYLYFILLLTLYFVPFFSQIYQYIREISTQIGIAGALNRYRLFIIAYL